MTELGETDNNKSDNKRRPWQPTPVFLPGNPMDRRTWQATVHEVAKIYHTLFIS